MGLSKIVVGVDGSDNSLAAVRFAADLAVGLKAEVVAVHALGLLEHLETGAPPVPVESHQEEISAHLHDVWCAPLTAAGARFRPELVFGSPVEALLRTAEDEDADLIVVGSRGIGGRSSALLGSTSTQVSHRSSRPVTIVPPPTRNV